MGCAGDAIREVLELAQDKAEIRPVKSRAHLKKSLIAMRYGWRLPPPRTSRVCARSPALTWRRPDRVTWLPLRNWPIGSTAGQRRRLWATTRPILLAWCSRASHGLTIRCRAAGHLSALMSMKIVGGESAVAATEAAGRLARQSR